jgi:site-specific DNA-cytosine methylase
LGGAGGEGLVRVLRALSLFSGIGGLDLAAEMAGIETAAFCEIEPFPVEVLKKRFPDVPIFGDVRKLKRGDIDGTIDIIHGGFPCQDLSTAGKQRGLEGERSGLWFEMLRVIHEIRPRYVLAENVRGAVNLALDTVYSNLVNEGYKVYPYVISASAVGAPHQRERLFVVGVREDVHRQYTEAMANTRCELRQGSEFSRADGVKTGNRDADKFERPSGTLWPTPQAVDGSAGGIISPDDTYVQKESGLFRKINRNGTDGSVGLARMVKLWPTPRAQEPGRTTEGYGRGLQELTGWQN